MSHPPGRLHAWQVLRLVMESGCGLIQASGRRSHVLVDLVGRDPAVLRRLGLELSRCIGKLVGKNRGLVGNFACKRGRSAICHVLLLTLSRSTRCAKRSRRIARGAATLFAAGNPTSNRSFGVQPRKKRARVPLLPSGEKTTAGRRLT